MSAKEVCEKLGISRVTLHRRVVEGAITPLPKAPGQKKRHRLEFKSADVERLAQQGA